MINIVSKNNKLFDVICDTNNEKWQIKADGNFSLSIYKGIGTVSNIHIFSLNDMFYGKIIIKGENECLEKEYTIPFSNYEMTNFEVFPNQLDIISGGTSSFTIETSHGAEFSYDKDVIQLNPEEISSGFTTVTVSNINSYSPINYVTIKENDTDLVKVLKINSIIQRKTFLDAFYLNDVAIPTNHSIILSEGNELLFYVISSNSITISDNNNMSILSSSVNDNKNIFTIRVNNGTTNILIRNSDNLTYSFSLIYFS